MVVGLAILGAAVLPAGAGLAALRDGSSTAAPARASHLAGFATSRASVKVGGELWDTATVLPRAARTVTVQYRRLGTKAFTHGFTGHASARGVVALRLRPPAAGTWQFRAVGSETSRDRGFVSPLRTVVATGHARPSHLQGFTTAPTTLELGGTLADAVTVLPRGARTVQVQATRPGSATFVTQSTATTAASGAYQARYRPSSAGLWHYRIVVRASATALPTTSRTRTINVVEPSPATVSPRPGTTAGSTTTGNTAPSNPEPNNPGPSNPAPNDPPAGNGTPPGDSTGGGTTGDDGSADDRTGLTTAALAVHVPGYPNEAPTTALTVNQLYAFDASPSQAADSRTLTSATLDYGDGERFTFTDSNGPFDYWNTVHAYTTSGSKTVALTVTDSSGDTHTTRITIHVADAATADVTAATP